MELYIPILGLYNKFKLDDIQEIEILNLDSPGKSVLPPLTNINQKAVFLLGLIDQIFSLNEKKELHAVYKFPNLNNPEIFQGQEDIESIGLGLITAAYHFAVKYKAVCKYEIACVTGVLKRYPGKTEIQSARFIDETTGNLTEKLEAFINFLRNKKFKEKRAVFIYSGEMREEELQAKIPAAGREFITVKRVADFKELLTLLYKKNPACTGPRLWLSLSAAAILLFCAVFFPVRAWLSSDKAAQQHALFIPEQEWTGSGELLKTYQYLAEIHTLCLEKSDGYIFTYFPTFSLRRFPCVTLIAEGRSYHNGFFIEIKNKADELILSRKIKVEFPFTNFQYRSFHFDLSGFIENLDDTASLLVISDPEDVIKISNMIFSRQPGTDSSLLAFDGRRFTTDCDTELLKTINFAAGGSIVFQHENELVLKESPGWIWSFIPETDLKEYGTVVFTVKTNSPAGFFLELKHKTSEHEWQIIGDKTLDRMRLNFPDTRGEFRTISFPLKIRPGMEELSTAQVMAISDPSAFITIAGMNFSLQ